MTDDRADGSETRAKAYTHRLVSKTRSGWRRHLDVQRPYRWNLRRLEPGRCLDIGCGVGRNLEHLPTGSVGVDHNATSVDECRRRGLEAYLPQELEAQKLGTFDSLLCAHVLEHLGPENGVALLRQYIQFLSPDAKIIVITPQERGFASDRTHVRWVGFDEARSACGEVGFRTRQQYSFPFPRPVGKIFYANEFVTVAERDLFGL